MSGASPSGSGRVLSNPPSDGISNLRFSNHSDHLLVSSWDKVPFTFISRNPACEISRVASLIESLFLPGQSVRLYDASANVLKGKFMHGGPVLDCCFHDDSSGFSASADHTVRRYVFSSGKEDILGRHAAPVRCVEYSYATGW
ncbi:hypothetical protein KSP40_PGU009987 [Platanthera guangdongensis]|uniref:Transducin/WD40 repeat-like superfamily protein n=1 Tax=Platanthera guangdongensis TaxID=2320717 RepID=A0ABR2LC58_9ASPA